MKIGGNANHPKKGDRIKVDPIRKIKDIKAIARLTSDNPRDHLLFIMGINNGLRAGDLVKLKVKDVEHLKVSDTLTIKESKTGKENILVINIGIDPEHLKSKISQSVLILIVVIPPSIIQPDRASNVYFWK